MRGGGLGPYFNRRIKLDFQGVLLSSDTGFLLFGKRTTAIGNISNCFGFGGDAVFARRENYCYCESKRVTYSIRLPQNETLKGMIRDDLRRPADRWPRSGGKVRIFDFVYRAGSWSKDRWVVCKIEWHLGELFSRVSFIVTNFRLPSKEVMKTYNGRANVEDRIKEGKNTSRWYNTSCHKFDANQARRKMGLLAYNLLHLLREFYLKGEDVQRSVEWLIRRMVKVAPRVLTTVVLVGARGIGIPAA